MAARSRKLLFCVGSARFATALAVSVAAASPPIRWQPHRGAVRVSAPPHACAAPPPTLTEALGEERAAEVWSRRPPGALPSDTKQAALIEWLQAGPLAADAERFLYPCLRREPKLLLRASSLPALREAHAMLSELLREPKAPYRFAHAVAHEPALLLAQPAALADAFRALASATGLDDAKLARVLRQEPSLLLLSVESVERRLEWLRATLQIERGGRLQRVLQRAPLVLLVSTATVEGRLRCLRDECGVADASLGALVVRTPRLLHMPLEAIRKRVRWLRDEGIVDAAAPPSETGAFLARQPDFFSIAARECESRLEWLGSLGLEAAPAAAVVASEPAVLSTPLDQLELRAQFFLRVIGGSLVELCEVPHVLTCDLAKVPMLRHAYCLANGLSVEPTALLTKGDAAFCMEVAGCNLDDFNSFEASGKHLSFFQGAAM